MDTLALPLREYALLLDDILSPQVSRDCWPDNLTNNESPEPTFFFKPSDLDGALD